MPKSLLNPDLSVVVPLYNEEGNVLNMHARLKAVLLTITTNFETIYVDDGSRDATVERVLSIQDPNTFLVKLSRNFGHQIAVSAGLDYSRGKAVVIIDGDMQDPPELIPELYKKYQDGYHVVFAKRRMRKGESAFKLLTARLFYRILNQLTTIEIPLDTGDFRLIDRSVVLHLQNMPERSKFLRGQIAWLGLRQVEVLYDRDSRLHGNTGYTLNKMLSLAISGITGFSDKPLRFVSRLGVYISILSFFLILYALYSHFILEKTVSGWTSTILAVSFFGGIQLLSLGVIGEYLSRMHQNLQQRPLYIVAETICLKEKMQERISKDNC